MVIASKRIYTADDLLAMGTDAWVELWRGELVEVPPSGLESSVISVHLLGPLYLFVDQFDLGYLTNAEGGFFLSRNPDTVVAPDVGFIRKERLPQGLPKSGFCPVPPDFAAEVDSPTDEARNTAGKLALYQSAGVPLVWWIEPRLRRVRVHRLGQPVVTLTDGDTLDGEDIFPGFRLPVARLFR
jgi:Uma2 family endonuclease